MDLKIGNNSYYNVSVLSGSTVFYYSSQLTNLAITNESASLCKLDDLYTILSVNELTIQDFIVTGNTNTGAITETSAIVSVA
jgi:hypothetical protein